MTMSLKVQHKTWVDANPLRRFRKASDLTIHATASILGVASSTIQQWENGATAPRGEKLHRLAAVTQDPEMPKKWHDWLVQRPGGPLQGDEEYADEIGLTQEERSKSDAG